MQIDHSSLLISVTLILSWVEGGLTLGSPEHNRKWDQEIAQDSLQEGSRSARNGSEDHKYSVQGVKESDEKKLPLGKLQVLLCDVSFTSYNAYNCRHESCKAEYHDKGKGREAQNEIWIHAASCLGAIVALSSGRVAVQHRRASPQGKTDVLSCLAQYS